MRVRSIEEIDAQFLGLFNNPDVHAVGEWYERGLRTPGDSTPTDEEEYLQRARANARGYAERVEEALTD